MAAPEFAIDPMLRGRRRPSPYFFVGMAAFAAAILVFAFVPEYRRYAVGAFPIAGVLHIHAAIMAAWVAAFAVQAYLGATGRTAQHRRVGRFAVAIGWIAWASMIFVETRTLVAHPLPKNPSDYDWNLPGPFVYTTFAIFLAWAVHERRRPAWHKRLMTFALFLSLEAAIQRFVWIPMDFGFAPFALLLDVSLLTPMVAYDIYALKGRPHPATVRGTLLLLCAQALLFLLWGTATWRNFADVVAHAVHG